MTADAELLRRYRHDRDDAAFAAIIRKHGPMVFATCHRTARHRADAEDAFQATFLVLAARPQGVQSPAKLGAWLHGVAVRCARKARDAARRFATVPEARAYLDAARADLTRNAALFGRLASTARPPVEIAHDQALARYRVRIITPAGTDGIETAVSLDAADLAGEVARTPSSPVTPLGIEAGALTRAGNGLVLIDASDLMAQYAAWPLLKTALRSGTVQPVLDNAAPGRVSGPALPVDCRLVVVGEIDDYVSWCRLDRDVASLATLVRAFEARVPLDTAAERRFARHIAALVAEEQAPPLDASALSTLLADSTETTGTARRLSTNLDPVRECIIAAAASARSHDRQIITARDIEVALGVRRDAAALLDGRGAE